jgi:hypothetical protein
MFINIEMLVPRSEDLEVAVEPSTIHGRVMAGGEIDSCAEALCTAMRYSILQLPSNSDGHLFMRGL